MTVDFSVLPCQIFILGLGYVKMNCDVSPLFRLGMKVPILEIVLQKLVYFFPGVSNELLSVCVCVFLFSVRIVMS